ncbi:helix-turn-helix domain-containing protein [Sphingobium sp.]|uniref:helix-turn-helix domain-containing protein n=1 Tax=Sphingobium sp. TaxID=1912891 RepID=UPI003BB641F6
MTTQDQPDIATLTEREKQTLRLMVRGHDAKSIARDLGLSVHTINERLRDARRKLAVSSSREAARRLLDAEVSSSPDYVTDKQIGEDRAIGDAHQDAAPIDGAGRPDSRPRTIIGAILMTMSLGLLALALTPNAQAPNATTPAPATPTAQTSPDAAVVDAARHFLTLVDQGRWDDSYATTGSAFRKLNTAQVWADISQKVRPPLGALISRTLLSQQDLPAPPAGYQVVTFRTAFANKAKAIETVSLEREDGAWRVVGVTIE